MRNSLNMRGTEKWSRGEGSIIPRNAVRSRTKITHCISLNVALNWMVLYSIEPIRHTFTAPEQCISAEELRRVINAATHIAKAWHGFVQWGTFGGEGVMRHNNREEQRRSSTTNGVLIMCRHRSLKSFVSHPLPERSRHPPRILHVSSSPPYQVGLTLPGVAGASVALYAIRPVRDGHLARGPRQRDGERGPVPLYTPHGGLPSMRRHNLLHNV